VLTVLPPLTAYRRDVGARAHPRPFGNDDARWLEIATLIGRISEQRATDDANPLLHYLSEALRDPFDRAVDDHVTVESLTPRLRLYAQEIEEAGAFHLAFSILAAWEEQLSADRSLEIGRLRWQRARIAAKLGFLDSALDDYSRLEEFSRSQGLPELEVRSWIGYGIVAQLRGNYPALREWYEAAISRAEQCGFPDLLAIAHHGCMIGAAVRDDLNAALHHGWRAFITLANDRRARSEVLVNIGELLLRADCHVEALTALGAALDAKPSARIALPALGGMARAAAETGQVAAVRRAHRRLLEVAGDVDLPYQSAEAFYEVAIALARIGDARASQEAQGQAAEIATRFGFHELVHRTEQLMHELPASSASPVSLGADGAFVVNTVRSLSPEQLLAVATV
jgi:tetratricopeptide (TPR) repeat protein